MSVLIKGMEMPKNCLLCPLQDFGVCQVLKTDVYSALGRRADDCPLVELTEKHGRLIDADKIIKGMNEMKVKGEAFVTAVEYVKIIVDEAPTVIEAEDEG